MNRIAPKPGSHPAPLSDARGDVVSRTLRRVTDSPLDRAIVDAREALAARQDAEGYWLFELEADCTIPAEYIMMMHFLDEIDAALETKLCRYLRAAQAEHGGWPLYQGGDFNISCSVKAYYALKLAGDSPDAQHMVRARTAILQRGGAASVNVFTRIALALFAQLPWRGVPYIPVEIMLLPRWFPFHLDKVAYWIPARMREHATRLAETWTLERLNGEDGLGAIFPAMVNALEAMVILGYPEDDPRRVTAKRALQKLVVEGPSSAYCQPCVSPIWDTALASLAMQETGDAAAFEASIRALDWLKGRQLLDEPGDWQVNRRGLAGGGWAFQFANSYYPDLDDTAVVAWSMHQARDSDRYAESVRRALDWLVGMQSKDGGFAAFDADNTSYYLNMIPFADHGALLDPPTSDVTARVVTVLARIGRPQDKQALDRAIDYLRRQQESDGSWFGRWGTNYIYGTWSVLTALAQAHIAHDDPAVRRAAQWLKLEQNADGGWGESNDTYLCAPGEAVHFPSTAFQSAWALLGLLSAGEVQSDAVRRGTEFLMRTQQADGLWSDPSFTAPGFPRVFYLRYHGYSAYFPLWALAAYRTLTRRGIAH